MNLSSINCGNKPSFGSLKINKESADVVGERIKNNPEVGKALMDAGKELANTKHANLVVDKNGDMYVEYPKGALGRTFHDSSSSSFITSSDCGPAHFIPELNNKKFYISIGSSTTNCRPDGYKRDTLTVENIKDMVASTKVFDQAVEEQVAPSDPTKRLLDLYGI